MPAYNEAESIDSIIRRIRAVSPEYQILVVDDGSADRTAEIAQASGVRVVQHETNCGNGAAVKSAIRAAETPVVVLMDADGQHPPEAIPNLLKELETADMVVASRSASAQAPLRRFGNFLLNAFARSVTGCRIRDLTSGFRAARRDALLEYIHLFPSGFSYPTTSTIAFLKGGYRVRFVAVDAMSRRKTGVSKIRPFRDGLKFLTIMVRLSVLFEPLRIFVPAGLALLAGGGAILLYQILVLHYRRLEELPILLLLSGLNVLFAGLLADMVAAMATRRKN